MRCASCGSENEPGGRFCESCGAGLSAACPTCGEPVRADARFCRSCGTSLAVSAESAPVAPEPVAERRIVSILFADLVGFTTLSEDRDPESTRELLTRYFDAARQAIERHGGTVEKFIGDAVMAVWGTPVAHEDDAERAVRAGLELVDAVAGLNPDLQARAGVMTGEAAVTLGATDQGMVAGDLVNTAARLQGIAEPGSVLVGEATMRAASRAVVFEPVGEHSLKGKVAPVPAWRAARVVAARGGQQRTDALEPPFVGRDDELRLLKEQLHAAGREERARLVSITGPGGIGKSRLVWELEKYVDGVTEPIYWHRGRSPSYGEGIAFWALGEMVRRRAGLSEDDDEALTRERIAATVAEFISDPEEREMVEPALLALLGVEPSPAAGRDALFPGWRIFFERVSEKGTAALVFEDLQWADTGLLDFIEHLLDWSRSRPMLVVTLARPELFDRRPDWGVGRRTLTALALDPLTDDAMGQLLEGLVPGLPGAAVARIVERAEGIPLYAVETVRALLSDGRIERDGDVFRPVGDLADLSVPESLRSLIASRLDALEPADRSLVQDAAVVGQVFNAATLAALTGDSAEDLAPRLRGLVRRELLELETDPRSPERGQYKFVQALIREVAYATLALRDRRTRHLAAARHYEALGDDELAGALASHYVAAYEASSEGPEADAVAAQARIALRAAAERAGALGAHAQAVAHLERAMDVAFDDADRADLHERAAQAAIHVNAGAAVEHARQALAAHERGADAAGSYRAAVLLGQILIDASELEQAVGVLQAQADEAAPSADLEADLQAALSRAHMRLGHADAALAAAERALTIAEPLNLTRVVAEAMNNRAAVLGQRGRRREAGVLAQEAVRLAAEGGWMSLQLRLMNNLGVHFQDDAPAESTRVAEEMHAIARRIGSEFYEQMSLLGLLSGLLVEARDWDRASALAEDILSRVSDSPQLIRIMATTVLLRAARAEPVDDVVQQMRAQRASLGDPTDAVFVDVAEGEIAMAEADFAGVERAALSAMRQTQYETDEPDLLMWLAIGLMGQGRTAELRAVAGRAEAAIFQGRRAHAIQAGIDAGALALEGETARAIARFDECIAVHDELAQNFDAARWRLMAARLLPNAAVSSRWLADARAVFQSVRANAYLAQVDELERIGPASSAASTPTATSEKVPNA